MKNVFNVQLGNKERLKFKVLICTLISARYVCSFEGY